MTQAMTATAAPARLAGPMPATGRWGWYQDHEGVERRRASKLIEFVETDKYNLELWKLRQVAEGLGIRDDLVLAVKAMGRPDIYEGWSKADKQKLNGIAKDAMSAAKQRDGGKVGTALHDLTERLDRGEELESVVRGLPAGPAQTIRAYHFLVTANGYRTVDIERTVDLEELEVRGSFDRVYRIEGLSAMLGPARCQFGDSCPDVGLPGHADNVIGDVKSEAEPWLNGMHINTQLAIYSRALRMWIPKAGRVTLTRADRSTYEVQDGEYVRMHCVRQDVGVVVHLLDGHATPYFVDLAEGWDAAQAAYAQAKRQTRSKRKLGEVGAWMVAVPGVKLPAPAQFVTEHAVAVRPADPNRPPDRRPTAEGERYGIPGDVKQWVAVRLPNGTVDWAPDEAPVPVNAPVAGGVLDEPDRQAIEVIWLAVDTESLGRVWEIYTKTLGRTWGGRVAEAADARRRQIECPQRAMHTTGKCACGWVEGVAP